MFIGHYAAALVLRPLKKSPSLPVLFAGVQLMDIAFFSLALARVEDARFVPGITAMNSLDLYFMPFSHGLSGTLFQSVLFGLVIAALMGEGQRLVGGLIAGASVFSHWILDVVTHRPDMMLFGPTEKIGAGLWNYRDAAMVVESLVIVVALALYLGLTRPRAGHGKTAVLVMVAGMAALQAINWFGPQPDPLRDTMSFVAAQGLVAFAALIGLAFWLERARVVADEGSSS